MTGSSGTGSVKSPIGDVSGCVVYAMRVTNKMTMPDYDHFTQRALPEKIPISPVRILADDAGTPSTTSRLRRRRYDRAFTRRAIATRT